MPNKIYIVTPGDVITGGVNSLLNLYRALRNNGYNVFLYLTNPKEEFINSNFIKSFDINIANSIDDINENIVIVSEAFTSFHNNYKNVKKVVYWLGLIFYFRTGINRFPFNIKLFRKVIKCYSYHGVEKNIFERFKRKINIWNKKTDIIHDNKIVHLTNSYYAADFLKSIKVNNILVLHNPVREEFYNNLGKKEKLILFGPKTPQFLLVIIKFFFKNYECIRLKKKSQEEIKSLMSKALLFIEIGNFSGRDRMPREAFLSGAVIFTSNYGSAGTYNDLQIPDFYKIKNKNVFKIIKKIKTVLSNHQYHFSQFEEYSKYLHTELKDFNKNVVESFSKVIKIYDK